MVANDTVPEEYRALWKGSGNGTETALIIGQEQDNIGSGYQPEQAFMGDIAELNVWDHLLEPSKIRSIAECRMNLHGNVKKWEITKLNIFLTLLFSHLHSHLLNCFSDGRLYFSVQ